MRKHGICARATRSCRNILTCSASWASFGWWTTDSDDPVDDALAVVWVAPSCLRMYTCLYGNMINIIIIDIIIIIIIWSCTSYSSRNFKFNGRMKKINRHECNTNIAYCLLQSAYGFMLFSSLQTVYIFPRNTTMLSNPHFGVVLFKSPINMESVRTGSYKIISRLLIQRNRF